MIFKKVVIDGKEYYRRAEEQAKENCDAQECDSGEFIEGEIVDSTESNDGSFKQEAHEFFDKVGEGAKAFGGRILTVTKDIGVKIADGAKDLGKKIKEGTESLFNRDKSIDPNSTEAKLLKLLPYMNKNETHEVFEKILASDITVSTLDITTIMPFISAEDCDALFKRCIELGNMEYDLASAIPYVSEKCLSDVVTGYIDGKYDKLNIDSLYPFLPDEQIKRIFYHILNSDDKKA